MRGCMPAGVCCIVMAGVEIIGSEVSPRGSAPESDSLEREVQSVLGELGVMFVTEVTVSYEHD